MYKDNCESTYKTCCGLHWGKSVLSTEGGWVGQAVDLSIGGDEPGGLLVDQEVILVGLLSGILVL